MASMHQDLPVILHNDKRGLITIEDGVLEVLELSADGRPPKKLVSSPIRNLLRARLAHTTGHDGQNRRLDIHTLTAKGHQLRLSKLHVLVEPINLPEAQEWVESTMSTAYGRAKPHRHILLIVNPVAGKGKARAAVKTNIMPIFEAAGCTVDMRETTHRYHAEEIVKEIELKYDVIAVVSGDGCVNEVFNGLAARPDGSTALKTPIASIPTGSANSLFLNIYGIKDTFNVELACLTAIKGQPLPIDLISVLLLPSNELRWAFFSLSVGLFVDLDIGTESLRWMGDTRFLLGFIKGAMANRTHRTRLRMKIEENDKIHMARKARERVAQSMERKAARGGTDPLASGSRAKATSPTTKGASQLAVDEQSKGGANGAPHEGEDALEEGVSKLAVSNGDSAIDKMPDIKPLEPDDTWRTIESVSKTSARTSAPPTPTSLRRHSTTNPNDWNDGDGILYASVGTMPYIDRDLMMWPVASPGSGLADIVIQNTGPRSTLLSAINGAEKGEQYHLDSQHFYKLTAMTCENLDKKGQPIFTIDGEAYSYDTFHAQVHQHLGNILSLDPHFYITDFLKRHQN